MAVPGVEFSINGAFSRSWASPRRVSRHLPAVLGATLVLLLAACGGGEEAGEPAAADGAQEQAADESPETPEEPDPVPEPAEIAAADEPPSEGGLRVHRPVDGADADCGSIQESEPGARILFPGEGALDAGAGPVTVEVLGCSNTFETNVQWEAFHGENRSPTLEGFTEGGTMGDWGEFRFSDTYWTAGEWTVVVFEIDAESGDRREYGEVTFTVQ